jgi:hypothetical protein
LAHRHLFNTGSDMPQPSAGKSLASFDAAPARIRARQRRFTWERGLGLAGLALAVASGSFAAYMISDVGRKPSFAGAEYLTVFAKLTPSGNGSETDPARPQSPDPESSAADDFPTASIPSKTVPGPGELPTTPVRTATGFTAGAATTLRDYVLRSVTKGVALVESPEGLREVRPGTILPLAGLVTSIEKRDGKWVVVTVRGLIREARR